MSTRSSVAIAIAPTSRESQADRSIPSSELSDSQVFVADQPHRLYLHLIYLLALEMSQYPGYNAGGYAPPQPQYQNGGYYPYVHPAGQPAWPWLCIGRSSLLTTFAVLNNRTTTILLKAIPSSLAMVVINSLRHSSNTLTRSVLQRPCQRSPHDAYVR